VTVSDHELVVGWRIWKVESERLGSLAVDHRWEPGENRARCLASNRPVCPRSPGKHCQCGFWAVWSPRQSVTRAYIAAEPPWQVMGLISGWGSVALHGREGFRAERAAVRCLFTDRPWRWVQLGAGGRLVEWWRRATGRWPDLQQAATSPVDLRHREALRQVADRYAVPLVSLQEAAALGLLGELGVPVDRIAEAASLGASLTGTRTRPSR
jgi:hypothetical protein